MVRAQSVSVGGSSSAACVRDIERILDQSDLQPDLIFLFYSATHDDWLLFETMRSRYPQARLIGGTSCAGHMSETGVRLGSSIGLLLVEDPQGNYGATALPIGVDPAIAAETALRRALEDADCPHELPELIWIYQAPGYEEAVLDGLRRVVGNRCPIIGGSSADDTVTDKWRQLGPQGPMTDGLVVAVLFSSGGIGFAFQGGYEPQGACGVVTGIGYDAERESEVSPSARRGHIMTIDNRPAAAVYNEWTDGLVAHRLDRGGAILAETALFPLGVDAGSIDGIAHYLLIHPAVITREGGLSTFATIKAGTRIYSMRGNKQRLIARAARVAANAAGDVIRGGAELAGALVVYCGGCMIAVEQDLGQVAQAVRRSLGSAPFLGCFTFGEQGMLLGQNVHGNLMISAIVFGK